MKKNSIQTDVLILGCGVAGLTLAIKTARRFPEKKVLVLTKTEAGESNTRYAQGGIAAVWDLEKDNFEKHIADTLDAGRRALQTAKSCGSWLKKAPVWCAN